MQPLLKSAHQTGLDNHCKLVVQLGSLKQGRLLHYIPSCTNTRLQELRLFTPLHTFMMTEVPKKVKRIKDNQVEGKRGRDSNQRGSGREEILAWHFIVGRSWEKKRHIRLMLNSSSSYRTSKECLVTISSRLAVTMVSCLDVPHWNFIFAHFLDY